MPATRLVVPDFEVPWPAPPGQNLALTRTAERSGRDAAPFRMPSAVTHKLMTTLPRAWPSRMYWMAAGVWPSG